MVFCPRAEAFVRRTALLAALPVKRQAFGRGTEALAGLRMQNVSESARMSGDGPASARRFGGFGAVSGGAGAAGGIRQMSSPLAEHVGRICLHPWNGRRRERRMRQKRSLPCLECRKGWGRGVCDGTCIPCGGTGDPSCLKCRTGKTGRLKAWRADVSRAVCPRECPAWPFSALTGPPAAQRSLFSLGSRAGAFCASGGACGPVEIQRNSGEPENRGICAGARLLRRGGAQARALWKGGELFLTLLA